MKRLLYFLLFLAGAAAIVFAARRAVLRGKARLAKAPTAQAPPLVVRVAKAGPGRIRKTIPYLARVEPYARVKLAAQILQRVTAVLKDEGDAVKKGELMAQLDDREIRASIAATQSRTGSLKAEQVAIEEQVKANDFVTQSLEQDYAYWKKEWDRDSKLHAKGDISASEAEATHTKFLVAEGRYRASIATGKGLQAQIERVKAQIVETEKKLEQLDVQLSYTRILAPCDGVVSKRLADVGDLAAPGKVLFEVEDTRVYRVAFDAVQDDLSDVKPGTAVEIRFRSGPVKTTVTRIFPRLTDARTVRAEIDFKALPTNVKLGDYVSLSALLVDKQCAVTAPLAALNEAGGKANVYVVNDGVLALQQVQVGARGTERAEILKGLQPGQLVARGDYLSLAQLAPGLKVKVMP